MSDRIDELEAMAHRSFRCTTCVPNDADQRRQECNAVTDLATIAREAEVEADKWRKVAAAAKAVVREATGHRDRDVAVAVSALAAAIAAIEQEEAE